jgi:uncharacterized repeat protein (TIGR01451 family)
MAGLLVVVFGSALINTTSSLFAKGTSSGVVITNTATLDYKDSLGNTQPTTNGNVLSTVTAVYGISNISNHTVVITNGAGATNSRFISISNGGNASVVVYFATQDWTFAGNQGTANGWTNWFLNSGTATNSNIIAEDAVLNVEVRQSAAIDALNGSIATNVNKVYITATPWGIYTATNGNQYGGLTNYLYTIVTYIAGPILSLTKTVSVTAPTNYTGGGTDVVPGSMLGYSLAITNQGGAAATNIIIVDAIPTNTFFMTNSVTGTNATIEYRSNVTWGHTPVGNLGNCDTNVNAVRWTLNYAVPTTTQISVGFTVIVK